MYWHQTGVDQSPDSTDRRDLDPDYTSPPSHVPSSSTGGWLSSAVSIWGHHGEHHVGWGGHDHHDTGHHDTGWGGSHHDM